MPIKMFAGECDFGSYRRNHAHYVDKTGFLKEFLEDPPKIALFTRPRRFGKTLTMSMMAEFLDHRNRGGKMDLFDGLAISAEEDLCNEWKHRHPVVFLTFKEAEHLTFDTALGRLSRLLQSVCGRYPYLRTSEKVVAEDRDLLFHVKNGTRDIAILSDSLATLTRALAAHHEKEVIVLIDEYDVPLAKAREHGYYDEMLMLMRGLLSSVLKNGDGLKFGVMTGCMRIVKESVFTGLNNVSCFDVSMPKYSNVFGFTEEEVAGLLAAAGQTHKLEETRDWYDGYRFGNGPKMYCPWDIVLRVNELRATPEAEPKCFWLNSSGNGVIGEFVKKMRPDIENRMMVLRDGGCVPANVAVALNYRSLDSEDDPEERESNFWTLLYHTGYLTRASEEAVRAWDVEPGADETPLVVPNKEILRIFVKELKPLLRGIADEVDLRPLLDAFWAADEASFQRGLHSLLRGKIGQTSRREQLFHGLLGGILMGKYRYTLLDREGGNGRFDILVKRPLARCAAIVEIKRTRDPERLGTLPEEALAQIAARKYDSAVDREKHPKLLHWGVAFCGEDCAVKVRVAAP